MIVADTSAIIALIDADDTHHETIVGLYDDDPTSWVLPWAILPEVDYMLSTHVGPRAAEAFLADLAGGSFTVEWGQYGDMSRARELGERYRALRLGLVDAVVAIIAERLHASAIATLDLRDFAPLKLQGKPRLIPRDAGDYRTLVVSADRPVPSLTRKASRSRSPRRP